ncbi:glycosyltransferase family A protein [Alteromonas antoniana]|uniref:glycosyltransferase family A protein n=1 Tax=Alteromonas antoniana TaxID=2803813 RepID=UPI001C477BA8|nr:glycosyltransferase family A protein [Alteromonas antoniana]
MEAQKNNTQSFSCIFQARSALSQHRNETARLLYKLAGLNHPLLSSSVAPLVDAITLHQSGGRKTIPSLWLIVQASNMGLAEPTVQLASELGLSVSGVSFVHSADQLPDDALAKPLQESGIKVDFTEQNQSNLFEQWLECPIIDGELDVIPVFISHSWQRKFLKRNLLEAITNELFSPGYALYDKARIPDELTKANNTSNLDVVLSANTPELSEDNILLLNEFAEVTGIRFHLVAPSPECIFGVSQVMSFLSGEAVDRVQISDQSEYFKSDIIEFVKKLKAERVVITSIASAHKVLPLICKLLRNNIELPEYTEDLLCVYKVSDFFTSDDAGSVISLPDSVTALNSQTPPTGFITSEAVTRLGGVSNFRLKPFAYGGRLFSEIDRWWAPASEKSEDAPDLNYFPEQIESKNGSVLVFDIQPITQSHSPEHRFLSDENVNLRRRVITARRLPAISSADKSHQAIFIMTCFNKGPLLAESIFGVIMQSYPNIKLIFSDDGSADDSVDVAKSLFSLVDNDAFVELYEGGGGEGTYQLRNKAIHKYSDTAAVYLINDADDISTARRAELQLGQLHSQDKIYNFGDIVRINARGNVLSLEGIAERYGTASFAGITSMHNTYGYYENLRKGADTEYIERLQYFAPQYSGMWWRYPVLFQSFTTNNLTADIYSVNKQGNLSEDITARSKYMELFRARHKKMLTSSLTTIFPFDNARFPESYLQLIPDFLMSKQKAHILPEPKVNAELGSQYLSELGWEGASEKVTPSLDNDGLKIVSELDSDKHAYLMCNKRFDDTLIRALREESTGVFFETEGSLGISFVLIYLNANEEKLTHQFFWVNQAMPVKMPADCRDVQLGFRIQGSGVCQIGKIEVGIF